MMEDTKNDDKRIKDAQSSRTDDGQSTKQFNDILSLVPEQLRSLFHV